VVLRVESGGGLLLFIIDVIFQHRKTGLCSYMLQLIGQSTSIMKHRCGLIRIQGCGSDKEGGGGKQYTNLCSPLLGTT
jgi:hypothetical protein